MKPSVVIYPIWDQSDECIDAVVYTSSNMQGMCFAMWLDPAKVPDVAEDVMSDAGYTFPLLLANRVRAQCCDRMGRRFDAIMKRMPQVILLSLYICNMLRKCEVQQPKE